MIGVKCKLQVQVGLKSDDKLWVDGEIIQILTDGQIVVGVPKADQIYYCLPKEIFVSMDNFQSAIQNFIGGKK